VFWAGPAPLSARPEPVTPLLVLAEAATADRALFYATGATALAEVLGEVHTRPFRRLTDDFGGDVEVAEPVPAALAYVEGVFRTCLWLLGRWDVPPGPLPVRPPFTADHMFGTAPAFRPAVYAEACAARAVLVGATVEETYRQVGATPPDGLVLLPPLVPDEEWAAGVEITCLWLLGLTRSLHDPAAIQR
jgi:hypothetical protein